MQLRGAGARQLSLRSRSWSIRKPQRSLIGGQLPLRFLFFGGWLPLRQSRISFEIFSDQFSRHSPFGLVWSARVGGCVVVEAVEALWTTRSFPVAVRSFAHMKMIFFQKIYKLFFY